MKEKIYYQETDGKLLNVYRIYPGDEDYWDLDLNEQINDPIELHVEGQPHTTIRRVQ